MSVLLVQNEVKGGGSQLDVNQKALNILCKVCRNPFMCTAKEPELRQHHEAKVRSYYGIVIVSEPRCAASGRYWRRMA